MAYLGKGRKEDLFVLAADLGMKAESTMTISKLKDLVISSDNYDEEFTRNRHATIVDDRRAKELRVEQHPRDTLIELKRKDEVELERLRVEAQIKLGVTTFGTNTSELAGKEISRFLHRFDIKDDISLYLTLLERQIQKLNAPKVHWVSHLLGLLPLEVSHIIAREPDEKANDYDYVKQLLK